jgi:phosphoglycerate dehydrogenase-like enzyme
MDALSHASSVLQEPLRKDSPLRSMKNVLLAPHNANASPTAHERVHWNTLRNLLTALNVPFELVDGATELQQATC